MSSVDFSRLTAIVHVNSRRKSVERLIRSIGWLYPHLRVLAADDSPQPQPIAGADMVKASPGAGTSACRNALLARVRTPFFLLLEDNLELSHGAHVDKLLELTTSGQLDIAAGDAVRCRRKLGLFTSRQPDPGHATVEMTADALKVSSGGRPGAGDVHGCDIAHNFFVARTDKVRAMGGWDPQLTADERIEFFVRAQQFGLKVGVCLKSVAWRWADETEAKQDRNLTPLAIAKMGVSRLVDVDGRIYEAARRGQAAA